MNVALIFAGGTGQRMNTKTKPKQFLELHGKPILVYTIEQFQHHKSIDAVILVSHPDWIDYCKELTERFFLTKVKAIVAGGDTGQDSIFNGLVKAEEMFPDDTIMLVHDGVRPLIDELNITNALECVRNHGNAVTVSPAIETITIMGENGKIESMVERSKCCLARAPQCFYLKELISAHRCSQQEGNIQFIDSASMMRYYGHELHTVIGAPENIKITTPSDFYMFRAMVDAKENSQIFG